MDHLTVKVRPVLLLFLFYYYFFFWHLNPIAVALIANLSVPKQLGKNLILAAVRMETLC